LRGHTDQVTAVAVTPDGRWVLTGSSDATIRVWDIQSGKCLRTLRGHNYTIYSIVITSDGTQVLTGGEDQTVKVWDLSQITKDSPN
jgi:WD40 repeat protein